MIRWGIRCRRCCTIAGFIARDVDAVYLPFLVHRLKDFLDAVETLGIRGFSITLPHKETILKYLKECDPLAAAIGAVNTVVVRGDGSLYGSNTDYVGVLRALEAKMRIRGSRVLVFGAGGAARSAAFALARAGAQVAICARREQMGKSLARAVGRGISSVGGRCAVKSLKASLMPRRWECIRITRFRRFRRAS